MQTEPNQIDLMLDRRALVDLRALAAEIIARMEAITAKYPAGTFEEPGVNWSEPEELEPLPIKTLPGRRSTQARRIPKKKAGKRQPAMSLSEAILNHLKDNSSINIHEFAAKHPGFKKQHMYGVLSGLAKRSSPLVAQDEENRAIYHRV